MKPSLVVNSKESFLNFLTLFGSMSTLICCALPALLVSLGMGAVMAGLASNVPGLIWVSENKAIVFGVAGFLLAANGALLWRNRNAPCPVDPALREACTKGRRFTKTIFFISLVVYFTGALFANLGQG